MKTDKGMSIVKKWAPIWHQQPTVIRRYSRNLMTPLWLVVLLSGAWLLTESQPATSASLYEAGGLEPMRFSWAGSYRLITSVLTHVSFAHWLGNSIWLILLGVTMASLPTPRWTSLKAFISSAIAANLVYLIVGRAIGDTSVLVGASGGVFGVSGALTVMCLSLVLRGAKHAHSQVYGVYGDYRWKLAWSAIMTLLLVSNVSVGAWDDQTLVHTTGLIIGALYGGVIYTRSFSVLPLHNGVIDGDAAGHVHLKKEM